MWEFISKEAWRWHISRVLSVLGIRCNETKDYWLCKLLFNLSRITLIEVTIDQWRDATLTCCFSVNWNTSLNNESPVGAYVQRWDESARGRTSQGANWQRGEKAIICRKHQQNNTRMRSLQIRSRDWSTWLFCHWTTLPLSDLMLGESSKKRSAILL